MISGGNLFLSYTAVHAATMLTIIVCASAIAGCLVAFAGGYFLLRPGRSRRTLVAVAISFGILAALVIAGAGAADVVKLGGEAKALQTWASTKSVKLSPSQAHDLLLSHESSATIKGQAVTVRLSTDRVGAAVLNVSR